MEKGVIKTKSWIRGLDTVRFILAFAVLLSHYNFILKSAPSKIQAQIGQFCEYIFNGTSAVIVFFIISGFVIHYQYKNGLGDLRIYFMRRFVRVLVPVMVVYWLGSKINHPEKSVIWSLFCEMIYYAFYPFIFRVPLSWSKKFVITYMLAILAIAAGAQNDLLSFWYQKNISYHGYYWQLGIYKTWLVGLPIWLLGVLLAENWNSSVRINLYHLYFLRLSVVVISVLLAVAQAYFYVSFIISMNVFALLAYQWLRIEIKYLYRHPPWVGFELIGKFSYSLYLCHPLLYAILSFFIPKSIMAYPAYVILAILGSYLFYLSVEGPSHRLAVKMSKLTISLE